ncbi:DUF3087 family protein [Marinospirillum insulare]|uniref:DUF3087 domain-containing protein n=1 Tax=Marinospirillum insulare TaxID=217169 RepID=A0ABQ5ZU59_9GAMM|nr:DUF3087 family protein [Marinospirillum insulare]GLR62966.1 hypothetical protein GCM10007878_04010 [Marinospirillum insulare]
MFTLQNLDPADYRQRTRKSSFILIIVFAALAMGLSSLLVIIWGTPGGNNFHLNLAGVLLGLVATLLMIKLVFSQQPFMREAIYGWHLKRNLMRVTNKMHQIKALSEKNSPEALKLLRFYHLALEQMHRLEGDDTALLELKVDKLATEEQMHQLNMDTELNYLDPAWLTTLEQQTP